MVHTKWHETPCTMPGYFIFNLWLIVSLWLAFRQLQWVILQYDYDVNTTVLKLLYSTNSKAQHYKANGHLSIDLFVCFLMKNIMKYTKNTLHWFKATHLYNFQISRQITMVSVKTRIYYIIKDQLAWYQMQFVRCKLGHVSVKLQPIFFCRTISVIELTWYSIQIPLLINPRCVYQWVKLLDTDMFHQ